MGEHLQDSPSSRPCADSWRGHAANPLSDGWLAKKQVSHPGVSQVAGMNSSLILRFIPARAARHDLWQILQPFGLKPWAGQEVHAPQPCHLTCLMRAQPRVFQVAFCETAYLSAYRYVPLWPSRLGAHACQYCDSSFPKCPVVTGNVKNSCGCPCARAPIMCILARYISGGDVRFVGVSGQRRAGGASLLPLALPPVLWALCHRRWAAEQSPSCSNRGLAAMPPSELTAVRRQQTARTATRGLGRPIHGCTAPPGAVAALPPIVPSPTAQSGQDSTAALASTGGGTGAKPRRAPPAAPCAT